MTRQVAGEPDEVLAGKVLGIGAAMLQAGLRKAFDFSTTVAFMEAGGWRLPKFAAFMANFPYPAFIQDERGAFVFVNQAGIALENAFLQRKVHALQRGEGI